MSCNPLIRLILPKLSAIVLVAVFFQKHAEGKDDEVIVFGSEEVVESGKEDEAKLWSLRFLYGVGTTNSLGDIVQGQVDTLPETRVYGLEVGRVFTEDFLDLPIDLSANLAVMYHLSDIAPSGVFQVNLYMKVEWTEFFWNDYVRTRVAVGEGLSVVDEITYSEEIRRDGRGSRKLLNYLDFSVSLNAADLGRVTGLKALFDYRADWLEDTWVVANISHRSGVFGLFGRATGDNGEKSIVRGGDNILTVGVTKRF